MGHATPYDSAALGNASCCEQALSLVWNLHCSWCELTENRGAASTNEPSHLPGHPGQELNATQPYEPPTAPLGQPVEHEPSRIPPTLQKTEAM
jgi:hypothetical protein